MIKPFGNVLLVATLFIAAALAVMPLSSVAQTAKSPNTDRWIHVRIDNPKNKSEMVRVNVPLELAERVLPTINKDRLHNGKVKIDECQVNGVDLHALLDAVRTAKDGEFVTIQDNDSDIRVAKQGGYLRVHVQEKGGEKISAKKDHPEVKPRLNAVEIKVPMKVVDALFSAGKYELDLVAALQALSTQGDTELVSIKDDENTVRVWLDSKNTAE